MLQMARYVDANGIPQLGEWVSQGKLKMYLAYEITHWPSEEQQSICSRGVDWGKALARYAMDERNQERAAEIIERTERKFAPGREEEIVALLRSLAEDLEATA